MDMEGVKMVGVERFELQLHIELPNTIYY